MTPFVPENHLKCVIRDDVIEGYPTNISLVHRDKERASRVIDGGLWHFRRMSVILYIP